MLFAMQLIAIGESVNKLDKVTSKQLLISEPDIPWSSIKGVRILLPMIILM